MEEQKSIIKEIIARSKYEVKVINDKENFSEHKTFTGTPKKSSYDPAKIILVSNPFSKNEKYFEFPINSINHVEEIGTISSEKGQNAIQVKIWVKIGTLAIESKPFIV